MAKGETLADTIRVVSGYADAIVIRHPREGAARLASEFSTVPVINAGDGAGQHPSQTLLDLYTIRQSMPIDGIDLALVGDLRYGRTAHSLAWALSLYNVRLHTVAPLGLELPETLAAELTEKGMEIIPHSTVADLVSNVDVLYVTRVQRERFPDTASYFNAHPLQITPEIWRAKENLITLHPPRVDEIDPPSTPAPCPVLRPVKNGIWGEVGRLINKRFFYVLKKTKKKKKFYFLFWFFCFFFFGYGWDAS